MAQLVERLLSGPEALGLVPSTELGLTQPHNPNTRGHSWLPREFKASLPVTTPHKQINTQTNPQQCLLTALAGGFLDTCRTTCAHRTGKTHSETPSRAS